MITYGFFDSLEEAEPRGVETPSGVSLAVPDMSLSVRDIIERCRRGTVDLASLIREDQGQDIDIDDDMFDNIHDLVDVDNLARLNNGKVTSILGALNSPPSGDNDNLEGSKGDAEE